MISLSFRFIFLIAVIGMTRNSNRSVDAFSRGDVSLTSPRMLTVGCHRQVTSLYSSDSSGNENNKEDEIIARRIIVKGNVQGGYYRACVLNEARRFRRLVGTMSSPDNTDRAEIYIEGKKKMVEGFIRWAERGGKAIGLSQVVEVDQILDEQPTGLFDDFYIKNE